MSLEETATSETTEPSPPEGQQQREQPPEGTDWRAENTKLRQQLKHAQDLNREASPLVQTALALQAAPGGTAIIEKLQKGEPLTATQEKKLEKAQEASGTTGISEEQLKQALDTQAQGFEQRLWERDQAKTATAGIHEWATKLKNSKGELQYPGYEELRKTPEWNEKLDDVFDSMRKRPSQVPEDMEPMKYAVGQTYGWLKGLNPDIGKEKPSKKTESQRREAISQSSVQAGGVAPEGSDKLPDYANPAVAARGVAGGGRSFGSLNRT